MSEALNPAEVDIRFADPEDWPSLAALFREAYRESHPLRDREFWDWQYGRDSAGGASVAAFHDNAAVAHVGAAPGGGLVWMMNLWVSPLWRGQGLDSMDLRRSPLVASYPYGGEHSFSEGTPGLLREVGCRAALSVDASEIHADTFERDRYCLPRYDCNAFPFGASAVGGVLAAESLVTPSAEEAIQREANPA